MHVHGTDNAREEMLIRRLRSYTQEKNSLEHKLSNPNIQKRETRQSRLSGLESRHIPDIINKLNNMLGM